MTYCVALRLDSGMIFASDSRTNAGVDHIATFCKMRVYEKPGDRVIVLLSSGNLAITQGVINILDRHQKAPLGEDTIWSVSSMFDVAALAGDALREMQQRDGKMLMQSGIEATANIIVGGQIAGEDERLFHIYSQGNFIEASDETPYFQLGEAKYGKPILDLAVAPGATIEDATKCVLVSFDSTMRSNLSVGMPIDLLCYRRDSLCVQMRKRFDTGDAYFETIKQQWLAATRRVFHDLPALQW